MSAHDTISSKDFRILVVDDERDVLDVMVTMLEGAGYSVDGMTSAVEALQRIRRFRYDALVTDLYMPDIPGLLLHSKVKFIDRDLWNHTVFVSAHFSTDELRRSLEGSARFVPKPFQAETLLAIVGMALPDAPRSLSEKPASNPRGGTPVRS
jgi:two-component system response regulator PilR (NtrC family)